MIFYKKACISIAWCFCITVLWGGQESKSSLLKIESATISPNFAWLGGSVNMKLDSGYQEVTVRLPVSEKPDGSNISTTLGVQVLKVSFRTANLRSDEIEALTDSVSTLEDSLAVIEHRLQVAQARKQILWDNREIRVSDKSIYVDDLDELNEFLSQELSTIFKTIKTLKDIRQTLSNSILEIANQIAKQTQQNQSVYCDIGLLSPKTQDAVLSIYVRTNNAGWTPSYVVDFKTLDGTCAVTPAFDIWQNTLHNWENVNISINGIQDSLKIDAFLPETHNLGHLTVLGNSGKKTRVYHNKKSHRAELKYVCNQSLGGQMTLNLKILDLQNLSFQGGNAFFSLDGNFLGQSTFSSEVFSDTFMTSFPYMYGVHTNKEVMKEKTKKTITGKKSKNEIYYRINVESKLTYAVDLEIIDDFNIDNTSGEKVNFDLPKGSQILPKGKVSIPLKMEPNSSKTIDYGVRVSF